MKIVDKIVLLVFTASVIVALYVGYSMLTAAEYEPALGSIDYSKDPIQTPLPNYALPAITRGQYTISLSLKAEYKIAGVIVSTRRYRGGIMNWLSPYDYSIVWGNVPSQLQYLKFKQMIRFCMFSYDYGAPIDLEYIATHFSNNHMIPATDNIRKALKLGRKGDLVEVEGYLSFVTVKGKKGFSSTWNSSLDRIDKGNGACEIIYVTALRINDRIYR
jgi:hypothetical protein